MEGKKSFIIYTSWKIWLDGLNDEQKGQWLNWVMNYTNDEWNDKEIEYPSDPVVKMACLMAQEQLKRDLADWKEQKQKRADAGRLGGIQRAVNQNQALSSKSKQCLKEVSNDKQNQANQAVNVNDNVNVNVNDNSKELNNIYDLSISKDISKSSGEVSQEKPTPLVILPCIGNYQHPIFDEDVKHYKELYPAVDILQQFKNMLGWLEANPQNRKTKNGVKSFITRWLSRCQDKAPKVDSSYSNCEPDEDGKIGGFTVL